MNKKLIVCALFGLSGAGLCAMEVGDSYKSIKQKRIEALRSFLEKNSNVFDQGVILPALSEGKLKQLTEREQDVWGMRDEALHRFKEIRDMNSEDVSDSNIEQADQWAKRAVNAAKLDGGVITVAILKQKMEELLVQRPQAFKRTHRRIPSEAAPIAPMPSQTELELTEPKPLTTIALIEKVEATRLRRRLLGEESKRALEWVALHGLVSERARRYKGGRPGT